MTTGKWIGALIVGASIAVGGPASAGTERDDKLCEVIGEAPSVSVPPKDRLWFKENCVCAKVAGCGSPGSKRFSRRLATSQKRLREESLQASVLEAFASEAASPEKRRERCLALVAKNKGGLPPRTVSSAYCSNAEAKFADSDEGKELIDVARKAEAAKAERAEYDRQTEKRAATLDDERIRALFRACRAFQACERVPMRNDCDAEMRAFAAACADIETHPLCQNKLLDCEERIGTTRL